VTGEPPEHAASATAINVAARAKDFLKNYLQSSRVCNLLRVRPLLVLA